MIKLRTVNTCDIQFLYDLLEQRPAYANISHREMPTWMNHCDFVLNHPYDAWYVIERDEDKVGTIYLTDQNEIGIQILPRFYGNGFGTVAITELIKLQPRPRYLANISPANEGSTRFFAGLGFKHIQNTYEYRP